MQSKEFLPNNSKVIITISNYLGGKYYLRGNELKIDSETATLWEVGIPKDHYCRVEVTSRMGY